MRRAQTTLPGTFNGGEQTTVPGTFHGGEQTTVPGTFHSSCYQEAAEMPVEQAIITAETCTQQHVSGTYGAMGIPYDPYLSDHFPHDVHGFPRHHMMNGHHGTRFYMW